MAAANDPTGDNQRQINTLIKQAPFAANASRSAIDFGNIMVSAGNVSILAETASGTQAAGKPAPSISACSTVAINIENQGLNFLALSKLTAASITRRPRHLRRQRQRHASPGVTIPPGSVGTTPVIR